MCLRSIYESCKRNEGVNIHVFIMLYERSSSIGLIQSHNQLDVKYKGGSLLNYYCMHTYNQYYVIVRIKITLPRKLHTENRIHNNTMQSFKTVTPYGFIPLCPGYTPSK